MSLPNLAGTIFSLVTAGTHAAVIIKASQKRRCRPMRIWNRFRTALLCCLGALGAGLILSWLWNPGPLSFLYFGCSGLLGSILGLFALSPRKFYIAFAAALLAAAGLGLGLLGTISRPADNGGSVRPCLCRSRQMRPRLLWSPGDLEHASASGRSSASA